MPAGPVHTLAELASRFGLELQGDGACRVHGVATLANAGPGQITFLANPRYRAQLAASRACAVIVRRADAEADGTPARLVADDPYVAFARVAALFAQRPAPVPGIHPSAVVAAGA
ncbi:MAG: UDP-3-O-(3-hydroxymyristoyl)glucosamine N-acyltransferase, partial [Xanthomonadales bacterium]|nr:UDP-3-O-(3-hydroxymyristoyl)glucosamine N-acyltransferase [Xanthomonadales bacterium]